MPPLLIHLVFHPDATFARSIAQAFHRALNADSALPNLTVPTRLLPEDGSSWPPVNYDLDEADRSVIIVLADDAMAADPTSAIPPGRQSWGEFIATLKTRCDGRRHRFLPVQLTTGAWPLDESLRLVNFIRGVASTEDECRALIERRLIVEISRFLMNGDPGSVLPVQLFLSHAKHDIKQGLFDDLAAHLSVTQPVQVWIDSAKIDPGSDFENAIETGIRDSAVLVLLTEAYSGRPWCRREVLFAKKHRRPLVIIDALDGLDVRAFPYLGNAPVMSWSAGGARRAVDLLVKEQLRVLHADLRLRRIKQKNDVVLPIPPELSTLVTLPKGSTVLYPDPPLSDEETEMFCALGHEIETPLMRTGRTRSLSGHRVALSVSEPDLPARSGMFQDHLDSALLEISRHLLCRGCTLLYGGHLGAAGYTVQLFNLVLAHKQSSAMPPAERIINYVGWPLTVSLEERSRYKWQAVFERTSMPDRLAYLEPNTFIAEPVFFRPDTSERRFAWARGMTIMREKQTEAMQSRIVLGGRVGPSQSVTPNGSHSGSWYSSRIPGVLEEILLTLQAEKPLYLCGAFGGAAALAVELLQGRVPSEFTWDFHKRAPYAEGMRDLYIQHGIPWLDYPQMAKMFADVGISGVARNNRLTDEENLELFGARDASRLIELLLTGLSRL